MQDISDSILYAILRLYGVASLLPSGQWTHSHARILIQATAYREFPCRRTWLV